MKKVLFVCIHNSGRSQIAAVFLNHLAKGRVSAASAGTRPGTRVNPVVIAAMLEAGIDISDRKPKQLTTDMLEGADRVITMGCGVEEVCPAQFTLTEDWRLEDPEGKPIEVVRRIRDEIRSRVEALVKELQ